MKVFCLVVGFSLRFAVFKHFLQTETYQSTQTFLFGLIPNKGSIFEHLRLIGLLFIEAKCRQNLTEVDVAPWATQRFAVYEIHYFSKIFCC